jgi:DNA-binding MarR family transcriptional regulator
MAAGRTLDPDTHAAFQIVALANRISASASRTYLRRFGVGVMEWRVLALVARKPGIAAAEITQMSGIDKAPVSRAVGALLRRGLITVREDASDSRRSLLALAPKGAALHERMIAASLAREELLLAGLGPRERAAFFAAMRRLASNMPALDAHDPGAQDETRAGRRRR